MNTWQFDLIFDILIYFYLPTYIMNCHCLCGITYYLLLNCHVFGVMNYHGHEKTFSHSNVLQNLRFPFKTVSVL